MKIRLGDHLRPFSVKTDGGGGDTLFPQVIEIGALVKSVDDIF